MCGTIKVNQAKPCLGSLVSWLWQQPSPVICKLPLGAKRGHTSVACTINQQYFEADDKDIHAALLALKEKCDAAGASHNEKAPYRQQLREELDKAAPGDEFFIDLSGTSYNHADDQDRRRWMSAFSHTASSRGFSLKCRCTIRGIKVTIKD